MWGQRLLKLQNCQNCHFTQNVPKLSKMCKAQKVQKSPKTALSGLANRVPERSVLWVPECQSRPRQAQEPCPTFPSLLQLIPARSGPRSLAQLPRGSGRVPSIQGASQRSYKAQESFSVPRDVPRWNPGKMLLQPLGTVPRTENHMFFNTEKTLSWTFYFIYLTFKKLKSYFSCFYPYVIGSQPYWISTSCQPCLFTNCISCQPYWFYNFI